jgi:putative flavoprotein involved in K+ transport
MIHTAARRPLLAGTRDVVVIGAGHAGLAMSQCLSTRSIDHVVLERGEVANSWRRGRWDSLRLLTPNWQSRLPGHRYRGTDPDGYMTMPQVVEFIEEYANLVGAPVRTGTTVTSVRAEGDGYRVETNRGRWQCRAVVIASGACQIPVVPSVAAALPGSVQTLTAKDYRNPGQLDDSGVLIVGASATGLQLAEEIQRSGRSVTLAVGEHIRMPRIYRGLDIQWWLDATGILDERYDEVDDIARARRVPSPQLIGSPQRSLDLNALIERGVDIVGRFVGLSDGKAQFSGSLRNHCAMADLKLERLLQRIDTWAELNGKGAQVGPPERFAATRIADAPRLSLDLKRDRIGTLIWATGFKPDYGWLRVPAFDRKGDLRHDGGIVPVPGLYVLGLNFMRRRKSSSIDGAADDVRDLGAHLAAYLHKSVTRCAMRAAG